MASSAIQGQVDVLSHERPPVGAAEQEQRLGQVDGSRVDRAEAVEELVAIAVGIAAGHVEKRLCERERSAQLVGGVGCESLLFDDVCLESREEAVDGVGEIPQLVVRPREGEALAEVVLGDLARGRGHHPQRSQHPARDRQPSTIETTAMTASAIADWMTPWCRP